MPCNDLLWTHGDWAGNISCGFYTRRHKSMGFPWPAVLPSAAGEKKCFQNKSFKNFHVPHFQSSKHGWASAGAASIQCRLKGAGPAKARSWSRETDLKTKGMCRKPNNWGAESPRSGK